ncbi:MAG TPA: LuxR C-terminal-related transcriptional regulator [Opitutaceae bacterium]|nr:LuxR C-terminal-related transcriptional regulator [Opitutaceae bacterium]
MSDAQTEFGSPRGVRPTSTESADPAFSELAHLRRVVVAMEDFVAADAVEEALGRTVGHAEVERVEDAQRFRVTLREKPADLVICGVRLRDGDLVDVLATIRRRTAFAGERILVVTHRSESQVIHALRGLGVSGIVDSGCEGTRQVSEAIRRVGLGGCYWSPSLHAILQGSEPLAQMQRLLTSTELFLLAMLGDGSDDETAAHRLHLSVQGVHAYRKRIHRKLGIQHKGGLMVAALQTGLVRITAEGVERPGLEILRSRCLFRQKRGAPL